MFALKVSMFCSSQKSFFFAFCTLIAIKEEKEAMFFFLFKILDRSDVDVQMDDSDVDFNFKNDDLNNKVGSEVLKES